LSVNYDYIPEKIKAEGMRTYRSITVDGTEIEFSGGFTDLHTLSYQQILGGNGFGLEEARKSIEIVSEIRNMAVRSSSSNAHPFTTRVV
jgi:UDP-N-acetyl-2-amino-2-deoxyglucuronate dehydrogenase